MLFSLLFPAVGALPAPEPQNILLFVTHHPLTAPLIPADPLTVKAGLEERTSLHFVLSQDVSLEGRWNK
jgi:hypothetical protein